MLAVASLTIFTSVTCEQQKKSITCKKDIGRTRTGKKQIIVAVCVNVVSITELYQQQKKIVGISNASFFYGGISNPDTSRN